MPLKRNEEVFQSPARFLQSDTEKRGCSHPIITNCL